MSPYVLNYVTEFPLLSELCLFQPLANSYQLRQCMSHRNVLSIYRRQSVSHRLRCHWSLVIGRPSLAKIFCPACNSGTGHGLDLQHRNVFGKIATVVTLFFHTRHMLLMVRHEDIDQPLQPSNYFSLSLVGHILQGYSLQHLHPLSLSLSVPNISAIAFNAITSATPFSVSLSNP